MDQTKFFDSTMKRLSYDDLFEQYKKKYDGLPKHNYNHFVTTIAKIKHHRTFIRPMIKWWKKIINTLI